MNSKGQKKKTQCFASYEEFERCPENKSKCPRTDETENEVEEFFTLVDRIQALNKLCNKKRTNSTSILFKEEIVGSDVPNGKTPWKPVFQQEDFSELPSKGSPCAEKGPTSINKIAGGSGLRQKQSIGSKKLMGVESFDLNVEATLDQSGREVLKLFS